jgi:hypothetical protein
MSAGVQVRVAPPPRATPLPRHGNGDGGGGDGLRRGLRSSRDDVRAARALGGSADGPAAAEAAPATPVRPSSRGGRRRRGG